MLFRLCIGIFLLIIVCPWVKSSPWSENFRDVPLDHKLQLKTLSDLHIIDKTWSEHDRYEALFLSQSLESISLSDIFSTVLWGSAQKKATLYHKARQLNYYRFHDERWDNYLFQAVRSKEIRLNWQYQRLDINQLQEKLKSPDTAEHLVLFVHADSLGYIWAFNNMLPRNFFSEIAPQIKSLGIFSCYSNKLFDAYNLGNLQSITIFLPNEVGEIAAWKSKTFLRLIEISRSKNLSNTTT